MKLGLRIFGCYLIIFIVCFSYPIGWIMNTMRIRYLEGVEDPLVDQANILAGIIGRQMAVKQWDAKQLSLTFQDIYSRRPDARIYQLTKSAVDIRVYITDTKGKVIFDSLNPANVGIDFSMWRDVRLTLEGRYGARSTLADPNDPTSSVLFVAAPIIIDGHTAGVLTVAKPTTNINNFLKQMKPGFFRVVSAAVIAVAILGYLVAHWITRPIKRLTDYAQAIHDGKRAAFPVLDKTEIGDMGQALNRMQAALEGKAYIEQYVQKLTHEVKSPLSAIRAAAELLEENVPAERRQRFLQNIRTEANRIQTIVDRMLELAALEAKHHLPNKERISLPSLVKTAVESKRPLLSLKQIHLNLQLPETVSVDGDLFLLHQAVANLIQNAIDFSDTGGRIDIALIVNDTSIQLAVTDDGAAIPDYALTKIFDKFFSLQRPDSGKKSTGLGLNLAREVAQLHQGDICLENLTPKGVRATLTLPLA